MAQSKQDAHKKPHLDNELSWSRLIIFPLVMIPLAGFAALYSKLPARKPHQHHDNAPKP